MQNKSAALIASIAFITLSSTVLVAGNSSNASLPKGPNATQQPAPASAARLVDGIKEKYTIANDVVALMGDACGRALLLAEKKPNEDAAKMPIQFVTPSELKESVRASVTATLGRLQISQFAEAGNCEVYPVVYDKRSGARMAVNGMIEITFSNPLPKYYDDSISNIGTFNVDKNRMRAYLGPIKGRDIEERIRNVKGLLPAAEYSLMVFKPFYLMIQPM